MLTGTLWPAHPHPYQGECLSSWIVRCAHANGLKEQTFCDSVFGKDYQIWNRDIDRTAPDWLIEIMSMKTGVSLKRAEDTTFRLYQGRLFPDLHLNSQLRWITPAMHHHRMIHGYAMQYCPICLADDSEPYYRLSWRLALHTFCPMHEVMMHDRCYSCGSPVAFHRIELGRPNKIEVESLDCCWECKARLSEAPIAVPTVPRSTYRLWKRVLGAIDRQFINSGPINYNRIALVHQICHLLISKNHAPRLQGHICARSGLPFRKLKKGGLLFEQRELEERHYILVLSWWLVGRAETKLKYALRSRALRINELYRDMGNEAKIEILRLFHC